MTLPKLTKTDEALYRGQKTHYRTKYKGCHISVLNAPDDDTPPRLDNSPWMFLIWREAKHDPDKRGTVMHSKRHFKTRKGALKNAVDILQRTRP